MTARDKKDEEKKQLQKLWDTWWLPLAGDQEDSGPTEQPMARPPPENINYVTNISKFQIYR